MIFYFLFKVSNILLQPIPTIGMQPIIYLPKYNLNNKKIDNYIQGSVMESKGIKKFSLEFSIDYKLNDINNTVEMIENHYNLEGVIVSIKKYQLNDNDEEIIFSEKTILSKKGFVFKNEIYLSPIDIGELKQGCQLISLIKHNSEEITNRQKAINIIKEFLNCMEITKENYLQFGYKFLINIPSKKDSELINIETNLFKIFIEENEDFLYIKEIGEDI